MATIEQLSNALINADKAGDTEAARALAAEISRMRAAPSPAPEQQPAPANVQPAGPVDARDNLGGKIDAVGRGLADTLSFGTADEITAQMRSGPMSVQRPPEDYYSRGIYAGDYNPLGAIARTLNAPFASDTKNEDFNRALAEERDTDESDSRNRTAQRLTGQILGAVGGGTGLAKAGLSGTANAIKAGKGLAGVTKASAVEGAILGGAQGFGSGEELQGRAQGLGTGVFLGAGMGAALPSVATAVGGAVKGMSAPLMAPFQPAKYTDRALSTYLRRSGKTPEQIASIMRSATDDGQNMYTIADAMGNAGQRALVPAVRTPNDARQHIVEQLLRRQQGQPQRLANALAEGFDAPQTAERTTNALTSARDTEANRLYGAARGQATPVNVTPILETIDQTLSPGVNQIARPRDNIAHDSIEGALARVRGMISDGRSQVTDFDTLFRTKLDLDDMVKRAEAQGAGNRAHYLSQVQRRIDEVLEEASPVYREANDTFARRSRVIDSVAEGHAAKSGRVRSDDSISQFSGMTPEQQQAFRVGYSDPIIADVESAAMGPATNRARSLTTPKFEQEFQAFAAPGRAQQLGNRIGRENRMFETSNAAMGNSRTADNLADIEDMSNFDPAIMANLLTGNWKQAAITGVRQAFNAGKGLPPRVVERVGRTLMETDPERALQALESVRDNRVGRDQLRALILSSLLNGSNAGQARISP
ncbi:hypothetical protein AB3480_06485 [Rhizobium mongolense]|uniref:hypothetical protein n=1 Tax=Rhizobium mongolense TaxID=57676 RepID=UPI0034A24E3E